MTMLAKQRTLLNEILEFWKYAWCIYRSELNLLLILGLSMSALQFLCGLGGIYWSILPAVFSTFLSILVMRISANKIQQRTSSFQDIVWLCIRDFPAVLAVLFSFAVIMGLSAFIISNIPYKSIQGMLLLSSPFVLVYFFIRIVFTIPLLLFSKPLSILSAVKTSLSMSKNRWWRTACIYFSLPLTTSIIFYPLMKVTGNSALNLPLAYLVIGAQNMVFHPLQFIINYILYSKTDAAHTKTTSSKKPTLEPRPS
jgi:hypothetical protein